MFAPTKVSSRSPSPDAVSIDVQYACEGPDMPRTDALSAWAAAALGREQEGVELTVRVVDEAEAARLNETYRHRAGPTNVLSFPFEPPADIPCPLLGDVVVCAPVVAREAVQQGVDPRAHWAHVVVHGVLHLLGYDHEREEEARIMESLEVAILARLGFPDPYNQPSVQT
ncbi:MAG: rRNA maturation RNase YbeY [Gammaproteobacteria bacterium]|nr:rRNA maturation RNase YbeY [Gammaproteobacteria bacterium]NIR84084.1 rRNA maturation RNase YbeY [Gammaproteobacteria bacterium]NIR89228.1 rRNA maturation RNase YbeY [Gammaproteobacteria bacterium]NIU05030.1 rRNA maturation RNase YbeY [Gammaproteobacteria bacterium]NIV52196.1 rRNA maturation RNase YbeY [Gammaproteobacteria bacterium]